MTLGMLGVLSEIIHVKLLAGAKHRVSTQYVNDHGDKGHRGSRLLKGDYGNNHNLAKPSPVRLMRLEHKHGQGTLPSLLTLSEAMNGKKHVGSRAHNFITIPDSTLMV